MFNKIIFILSIFFAFTSSTVFSDVQLHWNKADDTIRHLRMFSDVKTEAAKNSHVSATGVEGRYMSGSGQFTYENIPQLAEKIYAEAKSIDKIIIVDLRLESHGFINGLPIVWKSKENRANMGLTTEEIEKDENDRLENLLFEGSAGKISIETASTERALIESLNFVYVRLPVLDHSHPEDELVEQLIALLQDNPSSWVHFHCAAGKGRTTTLMALYDIYHNAKLVSLDDILRRQKEIGGDDLKKFIKRPKDPYHQKLAKKRYDFLKRFYLFCLEENLDEKKWADWVKKE